MLSIEIRERLVRGYERTHDAKMIAQAYGVSEREVYKLAAQCGRLECGTADRATGRKPKLSEEDLERVDKAIQAQPDITFGELIRNLELDISESRLGRIVREKLGYSLKKKVIHASEQERPRCTGKASGMELMKEIPGEKLVFLDESGVNTTDTTVWSFCGKDPSGGSCSVQHPQKHNGPVCNPSGWSVCLYDV